MAKFVKVASILFDADINSASDAKAITLNEITRNLDELSGRNLDLIVFSEAVALTGQTNADAETVDAPGDILQKYMTFARDEQCHIAGSVRICDAGKFYNSVVFIDSQGKIIGVYHKMNPTIEELNDGLTPGNKPVIVDTAIGRMGGVICFDLNFESLRHQYQKLQPDIIIFPSMFHGAFMQQQWAYECRSFFVSALPFVGGAVISPQGELLATTSCYSKYAIATINLDRAMLHLDMNMNKFTEIIKKYGDAVKIDIPPNLGSAILYSQNENRSAMDIVDEFQLELIDDYFDRVTMAIVEHRE
jgi:predicted amidohydrolase